MYILRSIAFRRRSNDGIVGIYFIAKNQRKNVPGICYHNLGHRTDQLVRFSVQKRALSSGEDPLERLLGVTFCLYRT